MQPEPEAQVADFDPQQQTSPVDYNQDFPPDTDYDLPGDAQGDFYQPPPGFKLIPESYIGVEPTMYAMMLQSLGQARTPMQPSEIRVSMPEPRQELPDEVFEIRMLQQLAVGDIGYNFQRGEEFKYCPEKRYIEVGGDKYTTLRSFLNMWNAHYGARPDPNVQRNPFFVILNPESCPDLAASLGKKVVSRFRTEDDRIAYEESRGDMGQQRQHLHGASNEYAALGIQQPPPVDPRDVDRNPDETLHPYRRPGRMQPQQPDPNRQDARAYNQHVRQQAYEQRVQQPRDPQAELNYMLQSRVPTMPPRGGITGTDGLTDRGRMIKAMSGDQVQRPVQRQQMHVPIGGYEPPESVENFRVDPGVMGGGRVVSHIPGEPADEAISKAQMMDQEAARLQGHRTNY